MESPWMQEQYIEEAGKSLEGFRKVRDGLYNCKCPICGDSATNAFKRRGYFIRHPEGKGWSFYCHNCNASFGVQKFLKTIDEELYRRYCLEAFKAEKEKEKARRRARQQGEYFDEEEYDKTASSTTGWKFLAR